MDVSPDHLTLYVDAFDGNSQSDLQPSASYPTSPTPHCQPESSAVSDTRMPNHVANDPSRHASPLTVPEPTPGRELSPLSVLSYEDNEPSLNASLADPGPQPALLSYNLQLHARPFRSDGVHSPESRGQTRWYYSKAPSHIDAPPMVSAPLERGDLFLHEGTKNALFQAWIWDGQWTRTQDGVPHPLFGDERRLWFRTRKRGLASGDRYEPNWVCEKTWKSYQSGRPVRRDW